MRTSRCGLSTVPALRLGCRRAHGEATSRRHHHLRAIRTIAEALPGPRLDVGLSPPPPATSQPSHAASDGDRGHRFRDNNRGLRRRRFRGCRRRLRRNGRGLLRRLLRRPRCAPPSQGRQGDALYRASTRPPAPSRSQRRRYRGSGGRTPPAPPRSANSAPGSRPARRRTTARRAPRHAGVRRRAAAPTRASNRDSRSGCCLLPVSHPTSAVTRVNIVWISRPGVSKCRKHRGGKGAVAPNPVACGLAGHGGVDDKRVAAQLRKQRQPLVRAKPLAFPARRNCSGNGLSRQASSTNTLTRAAFSMRSTVFLDADQPAQRAALARGLEAGGHEVAALVDAHAVAGEEEQRDIGVLRLPLELVERGVELGLREVVAFHHVELQAP